MKKLITKWFKKWSKKSNIDFNDLNDSILNLELGLSAARLGNNLYKVRVKRKDSGKSSAFRTIIVYKENEIAIFLYGFKKNEKDNVNSTELKYLMKLGNDLISLNNRELNKLMINNMLFDIEEVK